MLYSNFQSITNKNMATLNKMTNIYMNAAFFSLFVAHDIS